MEILDFAPIASGICWTVTYFALVYRGFKDKSYGMPIAVLALNFAWETTFSVIYPPADGGFALTIINTIWMICDIGIVVTYFLYGFKYFKKQYGISKNIFYVGSVLAFVLAFLMMLTGGQFFGSFAQYFKSDIFEGAQFIALMQNAIMSVLFVAFFYSRKKMGSSIEGQSIYAAIAKMIGTSFTVGIYYIVTHPGTWYFMGVMIATSLIFDMWYCIILYKEIKAQEYSPFRRF